MKKTSTFQNALIWFGAGVSLAEILTGTAFAPLGMGKGLLAILIGHVIGCGMMLLAGLIGGRTGRSAMETVKMSFGQKGGLLFALLNVLQLVGWTAIMIYDGALATNTVILSKLQMRSSDPRSRSSTASTFIMALRAHFWPCSVVYSWPSLPNASSPGMLQPQPETYISLFSPNVLVGAYKPPLPGAAGSVTPSSFSFSAYIWSSSL